MSSKPVAKINFEKYRSEELFVAVFGLINLRGIYIKSFFRIVLVVLVLIAIGTMAFWNRGVPCLIAMVVCMLFAGGFAGLFFAIAEVIRQSIDNLLKVVSLMLDVAKQVARDLSAVSSGDAQMPSAKVIVQGVYTEVFLPILERVISESLWVFSWPVLFLYRLTFGRLVKMVVKLIPGAAIAFGDGKGIEEAAGTVKTDLQNIQKNETRIVAALDWTQEKLLTVSGWFKFLVILPCYLVFAFILALIAAPIAGFWWMTSPEQAADAVETAWHHLNHHGLSHLI